MAARVSDPMVLYRSERYFSAFPALAALPSGDILLAFRRAPDHRWLLGDITDADFNSVDHVHPKSHIALRRFGQNLQPLGDIVTMPMHPEAADQDGNLFVTRPGRLLHSSFLWYPVTGAVAGKVTDRPAFVTRWEGGEARYVYWGSYVRLSDDEGRTWGDYRRLPTDPDHGPSKWPDEHLAGPVRGRMVELDDGTLLLSRYMGGVKGHENQVTRLVKSVDGGESWQAVGPVVAMAGVDLQEPALARWPEGGLTVFHRTSGHEDRLVIATSCDGGGSFDPPVTIPIKGHPYDPLVLPDGRLLLIYGYRHEPMGVRARLIEPGQAIEDAEEIVIRSDSPSRDTGYPSAVRLADGRILIATYIADKRGIRGIEGSLLELE